MQRCQFTRIQSIDICIIFQHFLYTGIISVLHNAYDSDIIVIVVFVGKNSHFVSLLPSYDVDRFDVLGSPHTTLVPAKIILTNKNWSFVRESHWKSVRRVSPTLLLSTLHYGRTEESGRCTWMWKWWTSVCEVWNFLKFKSTVLWITNNKSRMVARHTSAAFEKLMAYYSWPTGINISVVPFIL